MVQKVRDRNITVSPDKFDTLPKYLKRNHLIWDDKVAMRQKDFGVWIESTWGETYEKAKRFGLGMRSLGLVRQDKVCFIGDNELELYWAMYGVWCVGAVVFGVWVDALPSEVEYFLTDSDAVFVVCRDQEQIDKVLRIRDKLSKIRKVIWWDPKGMNDTVYKNDPWITGFNTVCELGRRYEQEHPGAFEEEIDCVKPEDVASMYYTSGTTGAAKGVVRTQSAQIFQREAINTYYPVFPGDNALAALSVASIGEPMLGSCASLMNGITLNFVESPDTLQQDLREIGPQYQIYTPRFWEDLASMIQVRINDAGFLKRVVFNILLPVGYKVSALVMKNARVNLFWKTLHKLAWWLAFRPALDKIGLVKTRWGMNSGFVLGQHTFRFLRAIGLDMREFYAATEIPLIATHKPGEVKAGSVGMIAYKVEGRISDSSEFLAKGPHLFSGYYKKPEITQKAIDEEGWYHTGDAAYIDDEGHVFYVDRVSELAVLADGTKYSPQFVEAQMRFGAYIKDCWALGADRDFVAAILSIDFESVSKWAEKHRVPFTTIADLSQKEEVGKLVLHDILRVNSTLPERVKIKRYAILHKVFDADEAELTRTRKLRRTYMDQKYRELTDAVYQGKKVVPIEASFTYKDGRVGTISADVKIRDIEAEDGRKVSTKK